MRSQTVQRFSILPTESFFNSIAYTLINKYAKSAVIQIWTVFGPDNQHGKWDQTVLKSEQHHFYDIYWSLWRQLSSKKSLLIIGNISGLFFNTLSYDQKYCLLNRDNLTQPIEMQLSLKGKTFSQLFLGIFEM